jgi:hypothetical protein
MPVLAKPVTPAKIPFPEAEPILQIRLFQKQQWLLQSHSNEVLFGGAAGSSKSFALRAASILYCMEVPGLQAFMFRKTYQMVIDTHMHGAGSYPEVLAPLVKAGYVQVLEHEIRFWNSSRISLAYCSSEAEARRFYGVEIHLLLLDECTEIEADAYVFLRTRLRIGNLALPEKYQAHGRWPPKFPLALLTANPGGISHGFYKREFVEAGPMVERQMSAPAGGMLRLYINATHADNPALLANDPKYLDRLRGVGDPDLARALIEGDWDIAENSAFGASWSKARHVVAGFAVPVEWELWRGADDGYAAPACCLWLARDKIYERIYVVSELYAAGMRPEEFAKRVLDRDHAIRRVDAYGSEFPNEKALGGLLDSAAFADVGTSGGISRGEAMNRRGTRWHAVEKGPGSRAAGTQKIHELLGLKKDGLPGLRVFSSCRKVIEALSVAPRDRNNPEDTDSDFELSHVLDALRYALTWRSKSFRRIGLSGI